MRRLLVAVLALVLLPLVPARAAADGCPQAGGAGVAPANPEAGDFRISGGGWGHGAGMSQYGAQGAALLGCDAETIVETYYPGAEVADVDVPLGIRVSLEARAIAGSVKAVEGEIPWELCGDGRDGRPSGCSDTGARQAAGRTWSVTLGSDGSYVLRDGATEVWRGGSNTTLLRARLGDGRMLETGLERYRWGFLEYDSFLEDRAYAFVTIEVDDLDRYLYGLAEVPSSWPPAALEAQALAGRSYALVKRLAGVREACRCHVYDSVFDQVYRGAANEVPRWVAAVEATAERVLRHQGRTVEALYSSSHGGYSESATFVFGNGLDYIQPIDDSRWDAASDNPFRSWTATFSADDLGARLGVGRATSVSTPDRRGHACRVGVPSRGYGGVVVRGTEGDRTLSGDEVRRALGLRSTLFGVNADTDGGCDRGPAASSAPLPATPPDPAPAPAQNPEPAQPAPSPAPLPTSAPAPEPEPSPTPLGTPSAVEPTDPVVRIAGSDRIATAVAVSREGWLNADEVLLATARAFPDALAAASLAGRRAAPLLLTEPASLPATVLEELQRLGARRVLVLGGPGAVAPEVEEELREAGIDTVRLAGNDRYATAARIAVEAGAADRREVVLATGAGFADAVAAGSLAATPGHLPTLLTDPAELSPPAQRALADLGTQRVLLVGAEGAVSSAVEQQVRDLGYEVERLAGADRFHTSAAVAEAAMARFGDGARPVVLATGYGFPDALAAGALAARLEAPLQLVHDTDLDASAGAVAFLERHAAAFGGARLVGGQAVVSDGVAEQAAEAITE